MNRFAAALVFALALSTFNSFAATIVTSATIDLRQGTFQRETQVGSEYVSFQAESARLSEQVNIYQGDTLDLTIRFLPGQRLTFHSLQRPGWPREFFNVVGSSCYQLTGLGCSGPDASGEFFLSNYEGSLVDASITALTSTTGGFGISSYAPAGITASAVSFDGLRLVTGPITVYSPTGYLPNVSFSLSLFSSQVDVLTGTVPEPATNLSLLLGMAALGVARRRRTTRL